MAIASRDRHWMSKALALARQGEIGTAPNPRVGCILVQNERILAEGHHAAIGGAHAEVHALDAAQAAGQDVGRATAYVTLEPCSHHGRTPPCASRLIASGIQRVVVGMVDPDPRVSGQGIRLLEAAGIAVDVLTEWPEGRWINRRFLSSIQRNRPWIVLKCAMSADGFADPPRAAGQTGSLALTQPELKRLTHRWRAEEGAILVGAGTLSTDNPRLDVRAFAGPCPIPVVLDPQGRTSAQAAVYDVHDEVWILGGPKAPHPKAKVIPAKPSLALHSVLEALHQSGVRSVLVEGGPETLRRFMQANLWDEYRICQSPISVNGGLKAPPTPMSALLRGSHPFGVDRVDYYLNPDSADWIGSAPSPTLSLDLPS
ncbi:MAG: bifunctional diaminohydroxyphosphoribosylaminopyrimidine deaminase/5-amino-6-(5-phosphoribosylamino)uracil reductase RibD [Flavobacteriales bacterium]|nr:bifunctional diaminohydroxyphosphoribosylaminopyrimidine deaminase/5-amino-6-(5-phosphoribosylamino)uracil reductase RibD [Flavobacteriales bacterium]